MKRLILTIVGVVMLTLFFGCEKEPIVITPMYRFYTESTTLHQVTLDSITHFTNRFSAYVVKFPKSRDDEYFDPTMSNLRYAASKYGCTVIDDQTSISISTEEKGEFTVSTLQQSGR